jgi:hypothetical protein
VGCESNISTGSFIHILIVLGMQDKIPLKVKHDQLMAWIDLPFDERPQLMMGAFRSVVEMVFF